MGCNDEFGEKSPHCGVDLGRASDKTVVAVIEDGIFRDYIKTEVLPDGLGKGRDPNNVGGHLMNDKCEKCKGIGYINDDLSGTLICDCTFRKAGLGVGSSSVDGSNKAYLGGGVYADIYEGEIILTTENGMEATNIIYLDIDTVGAFLNYLKAKGVL